MNTLSAVLLNSSKTFNSPSTQLMQHDDNDLMSWTNRQKEFLNLPMGPKLHHNNMMQKLHHHSNIIIKIVVVTTHNHHHQFVCPSLKIFSLNMIIQLNRALSYIIFQPNLTEPLLIVIHLLANYQP